MSLKTIVKVGNISNLSDARYCAGMGVEMLGFNVIEGKDNFVNPKTYQEIRGWVSGPLVVVEIYGLTATTSLQHIVENYAPDYLELSIAELAFIPYTTTTPVILRLNEKEWKEHKDVIHFVRDKVAYIILKESENSINFILDITTQLPVLITLELQTDITTLLDTLKVAGIALNGSAEIKPGLKNYDNFADVFEQLELD